VAKLSPLIWHVVPTTAIFSSFSSFTAFFTPTSAGLGVYFVPAALIISSRVFATVGLGAHILSSSRSATITASPPSSRNWVSSAVTTPPSWALEWMSSCVVFAWYAFLYIPVSFSVGFLFLPNTFWSISSVLNDAAGQFS